VPLCETCHDKAHNGAVNVLGYVQTSRGIAVHAVRKTEDEQGCFEQQDHQDQVHQDQDHQDQVHQHEDPEKQGNGKDDVVREVSRMRAFGFSYKKIASILNSRLNSERDGRVYSSYLVQRLCKTHAAAH
jgi:hypothetical protein